MEDKNLEEVTKETAEGAADTPETAEGKAAEPAEIPEAAEAAEAAEPVTEEQEPAEAAEEQESEAADEEAAESEEAAEDETEAAETAVDETEAAAENEIEATETEAEEQESEAADEASEEVVEEAEAAETEAAEGAADDGGKTGASVKEPPIIKKKKKLDKTNIIVIVVAAVIVLACLAFVGWKSGWFKFPQRGKIEIGDYSKIEVLKSDVEIGDEVVQQYITSLLQSQTQKEEVREGVVEDGDELNIDYVGKLEENGEVFDGGSAQNQSLTIGSGTMIDGFESGLIGAKIGETKTIHVVFPENYSSKDLAGKPASFDVTINYKSKTVAPELTDEFVKEYSANYLDEQLNTVKDLEEYVKNYLYHYYLHNAMLEEIKTGEKVDAYDEEKEAMLIQYSLDSLEYYATMYGTQPDQYAAMYGFENAQAYAEDEAHYYLDSIMLIDKICKDKNITWTDEDFNKSVALYMARNNYADRYTVEEFLEQSGETWRYLFENLEFKYNLAMEALEPNVVFVDEKTKTEEEASAGASEAESSTEKTETTTAAK